VFLTREVRNVHALSLILKYSTPMSSPVAPGPTDIFHYIQKVAPGPTDIFHYIQKVGFT